MSNIFSVFLCTAVEYFLLDFWIHCAFLVQKTSFYSPHLTWYIGCRLSSALHGGVIKGGFTTLFRFRSKLDEYHAILEALPALQILNYKENALYLEKQDATRIILNEENE